MGLSLSRRVLRALPLPYLNRLTGCVTRGQWQRPCTCTGRSRYVTASCPRGRAAAVTSCSPPWPCPAPAARDCSARPCAASHRSSETKTLVRSKMADGSHGDRAGPKKLNDLTFSAPEKRLCDSKKFSGETFNGDSVKLSFYRELDQSESCEKIDKDGVAATLAVFAADSQKSTDEIASATDGDDRKKRCIDRYDSSESSDRSVDVIFC